MMKDILLIGGGGHCKAVIDVIEQEQKYRIIGIIDKKELIDQRVLGYRIIGCDEDLPELRKKIPNAVVTIGHIQANTLRIKLFSLLKKLTFFTPTIVSPYAYVSQHASIAEGTVIMHHALVNANAKVGRNCIVNSKALIEHDVIIEDNVHISTGAIINGGSIIKKNTFFGSGSTIKEYSGAEGFIKAGSIVK
ncbi:acetyltransferase [Sulfurimonas aquatica]|uniref:Acetyltransferase n=1 Tax=Sulfurimonas aquatica TaxID=2672570 RepID=A0A975AY62_9BACT|nr:NeuD/PglB/VioB family sugar acetyltransferase [Sulfurimonas aquatica]QSZ40744.1 acetyltransferase [Sulfurimonas aquatica]